MAPAKAPVVYRTSGALTGPTAGPLLPEAAPAAGRGARAHGPMAALEALFLPEGFPASVTPDYLPYQLVTVPAHVTGWLSHSLVTSSLLQAVGVQAGPAGAVAASAAIKWIVKDGLGAAGRFLVGGRLGREFDGDPRRWRMVAEAVTTLGLALEISTALYPQHFLALASTGNFAKAVAKGIGKPVFRVVQTHFASAGNVGVVAAKEEVWEVVAQLAGFAASIALLRALEGAGSWQPVVSAWALVQGAHVALRYAALRQLRFATLNQKRACALAAAHVAAARGGVSSGAAARAGLPLPLPGVEEVNAREPMLVPAEAVQPRLRLGATLQEAWGGEPLGAALAEWAEAFEGQPYLLAWRGGVAWVVVRQGATPLELLQAVWQAAWLDALPMGGGGGGGGASSGVGSGPGDAGLLRDSLAAARAAYPGFLAALASAGWDLCAPPALQMRQTRVVVSADDRAAEARGPL